MAKIEFYLGSEPRALAFADDGAVPRAGEFVSIRRVTYQVSRVTWAVDNADDVMHSTLRANVELEVPAPTAT